MYYVLTKKLLFLQSTHTHLQSFVINTCPGDVAAASDDV